MMRDIKFRAYVKPKGKVLPVYGLDFSKIAESPVTIADCGDLECGLCLDYYENEDVEIMQFTGLTDKNGAEIYEGDILRVWQEDEYVPNRDSGGGIIDYDREEGFSQVGVVGFDGCSFDYKTAKTLAGRYEEVYAPVDWINNYEVIGNIYENATLLNETEG